MSVGTGSVGTGSVGTGSVGTGLVGTGLVGYPESSVRSLTRSIFIESIIIEISGCFSYDNMLSNKLYAGRLLAMGM